MADAAVGFDGLHPLQIHADLAAQIAFDDIFAILNGVDDLGQLLFVQIFSANARIDFGFGQDVPGVAWADAVNVAQRDFDALFTGNFHTNDACHSLIIRLQSYTVTMLHRRLALPLLVTFIRADDADHASALDDLAVFAKLFYRRANFHKIYCSFNVMQPWAKSKGDISNVTRSPGPSPPDSTASGRPMRQQPMAI